MELFTYIAILLMVLGVFGILLPALPDMPLLFAGLVIRSWVTGFQTPSLGLLLAFFALTALW